MRSVIHSTFLALLGGVAFASAAYAQNLDEAIRAYNADDFERAAFLFYDVKENGRKTDDRIQAEYYLAHSLYKGGYYLSAYQSYAEVFSVGESHPYYLKATRGLLNVAQAIRDNERVPELISKGYGKPFAQLDAESLNTINYMIGAIAHEQGNFVEAEQFLDAVTDTSEDYLKARYRMGVLAVRTANAQGASDYSRALGYFSELEKRLANETEESRRKLYRLALLGKARAYYSQGDYAKSVEYYEKVPRFSEDWYDAMFESGWAYFQNEQFGKALGMVHSIQSPYFDDRYRAESWVLKATTYFQMCHFDRVRKALETFFAKYEPMAEGLKPWLSGKSGTELVRVMRSGDRSFPNEIRLQLTNNGRYQRLINQVDEFERELSAVAQNFPEGRFKAGLTAFLEETRNAAIEFAGRLLTQRYLRREAEVLEGFLNQARIIKFETADAERKMLEAGKDITKGPRAKGPRPVVPNAKFQYWAFQGEYWLDELGYYEHSIKNECVKEVFE